MRTKLGTNLKGKRPLGRLSRRWENYIKMGLGEMGLESVDCVHLAHDSERWSAHVNKRGIS
jgi:hypothetical protein